MTAVVIRSTGVDHPPINADGCMRGGENEVGGCHSDVRTAITDVGGKTSRFAGSLAPALVLGVVELRHHVHFLRGALLCVLLLALTRSAAADSMCCARCAAVARRVCSSSSTCDTDATVSGLLSDTRAVCVAAMADHEGDSVERIIDARMCSLNGLPRACSRSKSSFMVLRWSSILVPST